MIIFSKALADKATVWEALRASQDSCQPIPTELLRFSAENRPVVMWNLTRNCNLHCNHCYMDATTSKEEEMSLEDGIRLIDDLAELKVPVLILTGGEPLMSRNFYAYAIHAREMGLRTVISTNGTLITPEVARLLKEVDIRYVGVSIDSTDPARHDRFRGVEGSYIKAMNGLRNAKEVGLRTGLRVTLTRDNWHEIPRLLDLALDEGIPRFCLYHLVPTGRGAFMVEKDVTPEQRRSVIKLLAEAAMEIWRSSRRTRRWMVPTSSSFSRMIQRGSSMFISSCRTLGAALPGSRLRTSTRREMSTPAISCPICSLET